MFRVNINGEVVNMGREFIELFDDWAQSYDDTVMGGNREYKEVFHNYDFILNKVASLAAGNVLEFGVGTGNLTEKLLQRGLNVCGVEPSSAMREKAKEKFPHLTLYDGDFLHFPETMVPIHSIVSTYAFHHLTDEEKGEAIALYSQLLKKDGKIIFADTMYNNMESKTSILKDAKDNGFLNLLHDLTTEYYPLKETMETLFETNGFRVKFASLNRYVWLMEAVKR
jgi:putative AdoMet-dependent methyltransferase